MTAVGWICFLIAFGAKPELEKLVAPEALQNLAQDYEDSKNALAETENKKRRILGMLFSINDKVKRMSRKKEQLTNEMLGAQLKVDQLTQSIHDLESGINKQQSRIKQSLRTIYQFSGRGMVSSVFSQMTGPDLDRFLKYLKILSERDSKMLADYRRNIRVLKHTKERQTHEMRRLTRLRANLKNQEEQLLSEHKAKKTLLSQIDQNQLAQRVRLNQLRSATNKITDQSAKLDSALLKLLQPSFFETKGQLLPPVANGEITTKFGYLPHRKYDIQFSHRGLFFRTPSKTGVLAVADGVVSEAVFIAGFGHVVVLDHGHHYYTVYGNQSALSVKTGDTVQKGQILGQTGNEGPWNKNGVYFEVRHFAEPEDPMNWLKADHRKIAQGAEDNFF
jgi:septal ring factor EnvC (AmiA/AmiB activator)